MSKQLTLFGKRAVPSAYFKNPSNDYELFVNKKWVESSEKFGRKQDFLAFAIVEWEKIKNDKVNLAKYLENEQSSCSKKVYRPNFLQPPTVSSISRSNNPFILSIPAKTSRNQTTAPLPTVKTGETLNVPTSCRESYLVSQEFRMINIFFMISNFIGTTISLLTIYSAMIR